MTPIMVTISVGIPMPIPTPRAILLDVFVSSPPPGVSVGLAVVLFVVSAVSVEL